MVPLELVQLFLQCHENVRIERWFWHFLENLALFIPFAANGPEVIRVSHMNTVGGSHGPVGRMKLQFERLEAQWEIERIAIQT